MKKIISSLFFTVIGMGILQAQPPVDVWSVSVPSAPLNCTSTTVTVNGWNDASNYILQPITYSYGNDTIWVEIVYFSPQIVLGVLTNWSHTVNLGNVPYGDWTVAARGYLGSTYHSVAYGWLPVDACCPSAIPVWDFDEDSVCVNEPITVSNNSSGSSTLTYVWEYPGGTSTLAEPTFSISEAGTYNVTMTVTGDSCSDSLVREIEVLELPMAELGSDTSICEGDSLVLALAAGNTYLWSDASTSHTNTIHGLGSLSVTVTDEYGCQNADTVSVIAELEILEVDLGGNKSICPGVPIALDAGTAGSSYQWSTGDTTQIAQIGTSGLVSVTVSESGYCDGTDEIYISLYTVEAVTIQLDSDSCGQRLIYVDNVTHDVNAWFDGSDSTARVVDVTDVYSVEASDLNGCVTEDSTLVNVAEVPQFYLGNDTFICANQTITLSTGVTGDHLWNTGGVSSVLSVTTSGKYSVTVTTDEGCTFADTIKVKDCLGLGDVSNNVLSVYPTIALDHINIQGIRSFHEIRIFDALGKEMPVESMGLNQYSISDFSAGVYFVKVEGKETSVLRFIKE